MAKWLLKKSIQSKDCLMFGLETKQVIGKLADTYPFLDEDKFGGEARLAQLRKEVELQIRI
ncbi:hypothetical protein KW795_01345 [Candidatus Microgenomates bacterium]|nr:hypothetical protein [Candidatus Microgenomates bacterium]